MYIFSQNKVYQCLFSSSKSAPKPLTIDERAAIRHAARTPEQAQAIQKAWDASRKEAHRQAILDAAKVRQAARTEQQTQGIITAWSDRKLNIKIDSALDKHNIAHTEQKVYMAATDEFHGIIAAEKAKNPKGWMVDVHDDYSGCKCFLTKDKCSGIVVTEDGDIVSLFSSVSGDHRMEKLIMTAIENGGVKCDCYGGGLQNMYARFGAEAVGKTPFNKEFAPPDWDGVSEFPVVAMIFPKTVGEAARLYDPFANIDITLIKEFVGENGYNELLKYRDALLHCH